MVVNCKVDNQTRKVFSLPIKDFNLKCPQTLISNTIEHLA